MLREIVLVLWAAALAFAAVLPTESGDAFYFAFGGQAGAVNAYGQRLWAAPGELIASDPMGSCLAAAHRVFNGTLFLGTAVTLYTADGRLLWSTVVNINATALATNCVEAAIGGIDGSVFRIKDGKVVEKQKHDSPIFALAYTVDGSLAVGTGGPVGGFTAYVDRCGNSITAVKTDAPYLVVNSPGFGTIRYRGGLAPHAEAPSRRQAGLPLLCIRRLRRALQQHDAAGQASASHNSRGRFRRREDCGGGCVEVNPLGFQSRYRVSFPGTAGRLTPEQIAEMLFSGARIYHVELVAEVVPLCVRCARGE
jgi:hypothetical protein